VVLFSIACDRAVPTLNAALRVMGTCRNPAIALIDLFGLEVSVCKLDSAGNDG
jgi:hypothetical protein